MEPFSTSVVKVNFHLTICYYNRDLYQRRLQPGLHLKPSTLTAAPAYSLMANYTVPSTVWYGSGAQVSSIFRAGKFGRYVVTRFLADPNFHGHRPAVLIYQHLLWGLMSAHVGHLNHTFGSSHSAGSAYQKRPTWHYSFERSLP